jgi:hypothetical protein
MKDDATSSTEHPSSPRVDCPRCGYDIGAQAELARTAGTSTGNCSECGLSLEFATLGETVRGPMWFVESRYGRTRLMRRAVSTLARCARPHRFWSSVPLSLRIAPAGLLAHLVAVAVLLHAVAAAARVREAWLYQSAGPAPMAGLGMPEYTARYLHAVLFPLSRFDGAMMLKFATLENAQGAVDAEAIVSASLASLRCGLDPRGAAIQFRTAPLGPFKGNPIVLTQSEQRAPLLSDHALVTMIPATLAAILAPLVLLLLPTTLQRAQIRARHFVRAIAYSTTLAAPILALAIAIPWLGGTFRATLGLSLHSPYGLVNGHVVLLVATLAMLAAWSHAYASRYLRLEHALGVALASSSIAMLVSALATAIFLKSIQ